MHVIRQVLSGANLREQSPCEYRRRDTQSLIIVTVGERPAVIAEYVIRRKRPGFHHHRSWPLRQSWRGRPLVITRTQPRERSLHQPLDMGPVNVADDDE